MGRCEGGPASGCAPEGWQALAALAVPTLTATFGSQLLRLMASTMISVQRERLGVPLAGLGLFGLGVPLLGLLAPLLVRTLGLRGSLWVAAGGTALVRLVLQLVPDALARWLLAPLGVVCFLWFVPVYLSLASVDRPGPAHPPGPTARPGLAHPPGPTARPGLGPALLAGLALDTALFGLWGTWDYAWQINAGTIAMAAMLAGVQLAALRRVAARTDPAPTARAAAAAPLAGLGPALFLFALAWQNIAWQTVFGRHSPPVAFALVMAANAASIAAAVVVAAPREVDLAPGSPGGWALNIAAAAGLLLAALLSRRLATVSLLVGQVTAAVLVVGICLRAAAPRDRRVRPSALATAWTLGMVGFFALLFLYYAVYDVVLPYDNQTLFLVAAAALAVAGVAAQRGSPIVTERPPARMWPLATFGVVLLAAPAAFAVLTPPAQPVAPDGFPVRVMTYNLHFGFDVSGWSDLESLARDIETSGADVVGLQEVSRGWYINGASDMLAWMARRLHMPHVAFGPASDPLWGNAILSRHPITASRVVPLPSGGAPLKRSYLWARIDLGAGQTLRVIDTHLHAASGPEGERLRLVQVPELLEAWDRAPATVIMGDLNAPPASPSIARLRLAGLVDAWQAGGGSHDDELTSTTDNPNNRIDYIWYSPDLRASDFRATTSTASDHRGVSVTLSH
ncbi:MAG: endonuclease/exonuclease/phosphatase family protein [Actinomycetota bacterium]|nr:endonuclease/exonuclease/phosphatase family protein [Actinomycetota bacterium]